MARHSFLGTATRIFVLMILVIVLGGFGAWWLTRLGLIDASNVIDPALRLVGLKKDSAIIDLDDPLLLDKQRLSKQIEAMNIKIEELNKQELSVEEERKVLEQMAMDLDEKEKALEDKEKSFNEKLNAYDDRSRNIEQNARYLNGMRPEDAVQIMLEMVDTDIVDVLRMAEEIAAQEGVSSLVAYWLSLMPKDRAATIQRLMAKKSNN